MQQLDKMKAGAAAAAEAGAEAVAGTQCQAGAATFLSGGRELSLLQGS